MLRGIYTGASGMSSEINRMDAIAQNLANVDVTGYKRETSVQKAFPELLLRRMKDDGIRQNPFGSVDSAPVIGKIGNGVEQNEVYIDYSQGAFKETENDFDFALEGQGFFAVETPAGERYTRNGSFLVNDQGYLTTTEGYYVLGENGRIQVKANNFVVDQDGKIFANAVYRDQEGRLVSKEENQWEDTVSIDRLKVVGFKRVRYLERQGGSLYRTTAESGGASVVQNGSRPKVRQGFLEASNVNPVVEMVRMIEVNRAYEANQKAIQTHDNLAGRQINETIRV